MYGVAFGAAGVASGFSILQTSLFSLLTFSGASQFAAVSIFASGGSPVTAIATAGLIGSRNALYGIQLNELLDLRGALRALAAHWTIDESTNVGLAQHQLGVPAMRQGFWLTGGGVFLFWNLFTVVGAIGAKSLGNPADWGLDAAVPAAFLALLGPRLQRRSIQGVALIAGAFDVAVTPLLPAGTAIMATVIVAIAAGWRES